MRFRKPDKLLGGEDKLVHGSRYVRVSYGYSIKMVWGRQGYTFGRKRDKCLDKDIDVDNGGNIKPRFLFTFWTHVTHVKLCNCA